MRAQVEKSIPSDIERILDNKQACGIIVSISKILQKIQSKRAVSDIIVTLLLVAITVVIGIVIFGIFQNSGVTESVTSEVAQPLTFEGGIKLSAYDARDGANLMGITSVDNSVTTDGELITGEHVVLKITNNSPNSIFLDSVIVNEVSHTFDTSLPPSANGRFSILNSTSGTTPFSTPEIPGGQSARVVIKLGSITDIAIGKVIRIGLDTTTFDLQNFIITAGNAR